MRQKAVPISVSLATGFQAVGMQTHPRTPVAVAFPQIDIQAPAFPVSAVVCSIALAMNIIAISWSTACSACDCCRRHLDAYLTCVWLGEQTSAASRHRIGAGRDSSRKH